MKAKTRGWTVRQAVCSAIIAALVGATPAAARNWPTTAGWGVEQTADGCAITQEYEGEGATNLAVGVTANGSVVIAVSNYNWTTIAGQEYFLSYVIGDQVFDGGASVGLRDGYRKGFWTRMPDSFVDAFAGGASLRIYNGDVLVDQLSLDGTRAAVAVLRRCLPVMRAAHAEAERERERLAHIPRDPFASGNPQRPGAPVPASGNLAGLISADDYPAASLRNREQGVVEYRLTVSPTGRVSNCEVTQSSGFPSLDSATCRIAMVRARPTPARDAAGRAIEGTISSRVRWSIPE